MEQQIDVGRVEGSADHGTVKLIYILYLAGLVFGITALIGLIMAYVNKSSADEVAQTHYRFQIRTFWFGLALLVIGALSSVVLVGYLVLLFWLVWTIVRVAKGLNYLTRGKMHPNPTALMFG